MGPQTPDESVPARLAEVFRIEHARVVASVLRIVRDIDAAEEVVQDAFERALDRWPIGGVPDRPGRGSSSRPGAGRWIICAAPAAPARASMPSPTRRSARRIRRLTWPTPTRSPTIGSG